MVAKDPILLSLGIPTYNGALTINDCLESCLSSIDFSGLKNVEILVVDNCSTDETFERVSEFVNRHPGIVRLVRNTENIGLDRNIDKVIQVSKGEYVKLLGDDDVVGQNFVDVLIKIIKENQFDVLLNSFLGFDQLASHKNQGEIAIQKYFNNLEVLTDSGGIVGQIASITFNRNSYLKVNSRPAEGTNHQFLFATFALVARGVSLFDSDPKIYVRPGSPRFTKSPIDSLKMQLNAIRAYEALADFGGPWSSKEKRFILDSIRGQRIYSLSFMDFIHRYTKMNSYEVIRKFFPMGRSIPSFYFKFVPIALVPKVLGNFLASKFKK